MKSIFQSGSPKSRKTSQIRFFQGWAVAGRTPSETSRPREEARGEERENERERTRGRRPADCCFGVTQMLLARSAYLKVLRVSLYWRLDGDAMASITSTALQDAAGIDARSVESDEERGKEKEGERTAEAEQCQENEIQKKPHC